jgi:multiple sugar transport system permease protein
VSKKRSILIAVSIVASVLIIIYLFPVYWLISMSFRIEKEMFTWPPRLFPKVLTLNNYKGLVEGRNLLWYLRNSAIIAPLSVVISMLVGSLAAYGLARFRYPHRMGSRLASWILSLRMLPPVAAVLPIFLIFSALRLVDQFYGVALAYAFFNLPFIIWLLKIYFQDVPEEIEQAALVDGASRLQSFFRITIPLSTPGIATTFILALAASWNEFLMASQLATFNTRTLPVLIASFIWDRNMQWGFATASAVLSALPMMIIGLFIQRYIVRGLSFGAIK